jgi:hypothetical protein
VTVRVDLGLTGVEVLLGGGEIAPEVVEEETIFRGGGGSHFGIDRVRISTV